MNTLTIHTTTVVGQCPLGCPDVYEVEFHIINQVIPVESIKAEIDGATSQPIYQESLTQLLANRLNCKVVTHGTHGQFITVCTASPEQGA